MGIVSSRAIGQMQFRYGRRDRRTSACVLLFLYLAVSLASITVFDVSLSSADKRSSNISSRGGSSSSHSFPSLFGGSLSRTAILLGGGRWVPGLSFIHLMALDVGSGSCSSSSISLIRALPLLLFLARRCLRVSRGSISDSSVKIALPLPLRLLAARVCGSRKDGGSRGKMDLGGWGVVSKSVWLGTD